MGRRGCEVHLSEKVNLRYMKETSISGEKKNTHLFLKLPGSCSQTMRLRPPVTQRWSPLAVSHAAKQRILGRSEEVSETRYLHWGSENTERV